MGINHPLNKFSKYKYQPLWWVLAITSALLLGCGPFYLPISERNFSHKYNPAHTDIHPVIMLHRVAPDSSVVFMRIPVNDLGFPEFKRREDQIAGVSVEYFLVESAGANMYRDSGSMKFTFPQKPATNYLQLKKGVAHHPDSVKFIDFQIRDYLSGLETNEVLRIQPNGYYNSQTYYPFYNDSNYPIVRAMASPGDSIRIKSAIETDSLWIFHLTYNTNDTLPFDKLHKIGMDDYFQFTREGSYIINRDSTLAGGLRYIVDVQYFPAIREAQQMLGPIRYLTNGKEWQEINQLPPKRAVDTFWLVAAPDTETARQLIQVYYNRVQLANIKFSSHRQGWKTDMGQMMTLAGLPDEVQITDTTEHWFYFIGKNEKLKIPFMYNDSLGEYQRQRNDSLMNGFFMYHINGWRSGKFY